ncbi:hypothetical protein ACFL6C_04215 [Myxococcota bacterium]
MYSSLDRIDIVAEQPDGTQFSVQTDHRSAEEIESEPDLSIIFTLIRILNPLRMGEMAVGGVDYIFQAPPPDFLQQAVASAGAVLKVDKQPVPYTGPELEVTVLANQSLAALANDVAKERGLPFTEEGLAELEAEIAEDIPDQEEDEVGYWTTVIQLGAFCGEVIRAAVGGSWIVPEMAMSSLPFVFQATVRGDESKINPLGKAIKFLDDPESDSLTGLVGYATASE